LNSNAAAAMLEPVPDEFSEHVSDEDTEELVDDSDLTELPPEEAED